MTHRSSCSEGHCTVCAKWISNDTLLNLVKDLDGHIYSLITLSKCLLAPVMFGTIASMPSSCSAVRSNVLEKTRSSRSSYNRDSVRNEILPVKVCVSCTPDSTIPRVLQPRPSTTLPIRRFMVLLFPKLLLLFMCCLNHSVSLLHGEQRLA